jgi:hypothetical protein
VVFGLRNYYLSTEPERTMVISENIENDFFTGEVVELLLKSVEKPSVYQRALAASALWALLTNNQKVSSS